MKQTVILLHGLFMDGFSMRRMQRNFIEQGFNTYIFSYPTVQFDKISTIENLDSLIKQVIAMENTNLTLVGHSMGGLVARLYQTTYQNPYVKKIVTLGTPHNGSHIAKYLIKTKLGKILGTSGQSGIIDSIPDWNNICPLGCVIGSSKIGVNTILSPFHGKYGHSDGNVFFEEALLDNCTDHKVVPYSHTSLILYKNVVHDCIDFIKNNHFLKPSSI